MRIPEIKEVRVRIGKDLERQCPCAKFGDTLILLGNSFLGPYTRVMIDKIEIPASFIDDHRIEISIPENEGDLQPGPRSVRIVRVVLMGDPPVRHSGFSSNWFTIMLIPEVKSLTIDKESVPRTIKISGTGLFSKSLPCGVLLGGRLVTKDEYKERNPTSENLVIPLPDTLPAWPVNCLISGEILSPINLQELELILNIGSDGPHSIQLNPEIENLEDLAVTLQEAIRKTEKGGIAFREARVAVLGNSLILVPGGLSGSVFINFGINETSEALRLRTSKGARIAQAYLSGKLKPFPRITEERPAVEIKIGNTAKVLELPSRPASLDEAALLLEKAIRVSSREQDFSKARVILLENQLLVLPGKDLDVSFEAVAGGDKKSVAELQLKTRYRIRVRVNGAESIDKIDFEMP